MSSFEIDTGELSHLPTAFDFIDSAYLDFYVSSDRKRAVVEFAQAIIAELEDPRGPKKLDTVRKHVIARMRFLTCLGTEHPDLFDEFWTAYANWRDRP
jgi:hypothetical protein